MPHVHSIIGFSVEPGASHTASQALCESVSQRVRQNPLAIPQGAMLTSSLLPVLAQIKSSISQEKKQTTNQNSNLQIISGTLYFAVMIK